MVTNKLLQIINSLNTNKYRMSVEDIYLISAGVLGAIGNILLVS
jgi:hypothetical protein